MFVVCEFIFGLVLGVQVILYVFGNLWVGSQEVVEFFDVVFMILFDGFVFFIGGFGVVLVGVNIIGRESVLVVDICFMIGYVIDDEVGVCIMLFLFVCFVGF